MIGPNSSGKTAIINAVHFVLKGHIPEIGEKSTFDLASASIMNATVTLSDGRQLDRSLRMERGSKKGGGVVDDDMDSPMLDAAAWPGMSERKFIDYVFAHVEMPESMTPAGIVARLERLSFGAEHSEAIEEAKADVLQTVRESFEVESTTANALTALTTVLLPQAFTLYNGRTKDMEGATKALTELKLRSNEASAATLTDLRNELERLQGLRQEASQALGRLQEQEAAHIKTAARRLEVERGLSTLCKDPLPMPVDNWKSFPLEATQKQLREIEAKMGEVPPVPDQSTVQVWRDRFSRHSQGVESAKQAVADAEKELSALDEVKCCPHCGGNKKDWNKNIRATITEKLTNLRNNVESLIIELKGVEIKGRIASEAYKTALAAHNTHLQSKADADMLSRRIVAYKSESTEHEAKVQRVKDANASALREHEATMSQLRKELGSLTTIPAPSPEEIAAGQAKCDTLRAEHEAAAEKLRAGERLQRDLQLAEEAATEHGLAKAKLEVVSAFKAALLNVKKALVGIAFTELLTLANKIVSGILPSPLSFNEKTSEVGRWAETGFISHRTFSGSERALTFVAVAAALSAKAKLRVLVIDELGRLTRDLQTRVLEALSVAVDDSMIDQVIAVIPMTEDEIETFEHCEYSVINTSAGVAA